MYRKNVSSGSPFEAPIGFSRAVRVGPLIAVAGTAPIAEGGGVFAAGDLHAQTMRCLQIIQKAIEELGGTLDGVFRTRVFLTDVSRWEDAGRAHGAFFGEVRPACTFVEVSGLIDAGWLVEIEADVYVETER